MKSRKPNNQPLEQNTQQLKSENLFWIGATVFVVILALNLSLAYFYLNSPKESKTVQVQSLKTTPEASPEAQKELKNADFSLEVLNGSGKSGQAKKASLSLTEAGFKVLKVDNTKAQADTQLLFNKNLDQEQKAYLTEKISQLFDTKVEGEFEDSEASARLIIGKL